MGLDSVELLMEWEQYFDIEISDQAAGKIDTVQQAVDCIADIIGVHDESKAIRDGIFNRLQSAMVEAGFAGDKIEITSLVSEIIPVNDITAWPLIAGKLGLPFPFPPLRKKESIATRIFVKFNRAFHFDYEALTFETLTDVICGDNYDQYVDRKNIRSKYEIYLAIMAITADKIGLSFYDIKPGKSFTNDFGIN